jgi:hypothetical protein
MIAVATGGLVLTGALHIGLALLFALLLLFAWFAEGTRRQLAERTGLVLVLFSLPIFYVDWTYQALPVHVLENGPGYNPLVGAIAHLIVFLSVIKLLQVKADRDWVFLYLISFFEILLAAGLSFSPAFLALLIIYLVCALSTIIAFEIHKAKQNLALVETRLLVAPDAKIFRRLARKGNRGSVEVRRSALDIAGATGGDLRACVAALFGGPARFSRHLRSQWWRSGRVYRFLRECDPGRDWHFEAERPDRYARARRWPA